VHGWRQQVSELDQTCAGETQGSTQPLLMVVSVRLRPPRFMLATGSVRITMSSGEGSLVTRIVCACATRPSARARRRCQRQRRVEHTLVCPERYCGHGKADQRQRVVSRERCANTRLSRRISNLSYKQHRIRERWRVHEVREQ
jgi:hypothetical protein